MAAAASRSLRGTNACDLPPAVCRYFTPSTCCERDHMQNPFLIPRGHSTEPMAVRWQPQGGIVRSGPLEDGPQPQEAIHDLCWAGPRQSQSTVPDLPRALWPSPPPPRGGDTQDASSKKGGLERSRLSWEGREERAFTFAVVNHDPFFQISIHSVPVFFFLSVYLFCVCLSIVLTFLLRIPAALVIPG